MTRKARNYYRRVQWWQDRAPGVANQMAKFEQSAAIRRARDHATLQQLGDWLGVTRERVRQTQRYAERQARLGNPLERHDPAGAAVALRGKPLVANTVHLMAELSTDYPQL